jgi:hypothetical protein
MTKSDPDASVTDADLLEAIRQAPERWNRDLLTRIAALTPPWMSKNGRMHAALHDPDWWGEVLGALRSELEFLEWRSDADSGCIPPEYAHHLREAIEEAAAAGALAVLRALWVSSAKVTKQTRAGQNHARRKSAQEDYRTIRDAYWALGSGISQRARCEILRKRRGWSRAKILRALSQGSSDG